MPSESGKTYGSLDPYTGEVATTAAAATPVDVERAVEAAQDAFLGWSSLPPSKRRQYMLAAADTVEARAADLMEAITSEMGGPSAWGNTTSRSWRKSCATLQSAATMASPAKSFHRRTRRVR